MRACVALLCTLAASRSVTLHQAEPEQPRSDIQIPLKPITVPCSLSDIVAVSAPIVRNALYYLTRPNGQTTILNISRPIYTFDPQKDFNSDYNNIAIQHKNMRQAIFPVVNYKVFDLLPDDYGDLPVLEEHTKNLKANDFLIGPLLEEDHGNWMLSIYHENANGEWVETYQVITLQISDYVPPKPRFPTFKTGDTFEFSFAYSIPNLESCELHAPKTSFDRFYERDMEIDMARCGYVIKNVTKEDRGMWSITGVGKIVYGTQVYLNVKEST